MPMSESGVETDQYGYPIGSPLDLMTQQSGPQAATQGAFGNGSFVTLPDGSSAFVVKPPNSQWINTLPQYGFQQGSGTAIDQSTGQPVDLSGFLTINAGTSPTDAASSQYGKLMAAGGIPGMLDVPLNPQDPSGFFGTLGGFMSSPGAMMMALPFGVNSLQQLGILPLGTDAGAGATFGAAGTGAGAAGAIPAPPMDIGAAGTGGDTGMFAQEAGMPGAATSEWGGSALTGAPTPGSPQDIVTSTYGTGSGDPFAGMTPLPGGGGLYQSDPTTLANLPDVSSPGLGTAGLGPAATAAGTAAGAIPGAGTGGTLPGTSGGGGFNLGNLLPLLGAYSGLQSMNAGPAVDPNMINALWQAGQGSYQRSLAPNAALQQQANQIYGQGQNVAQLGQQAYQQSLVPNADLQAKANAIYGAGQNLWQTAQDPQSALYARTVQQLQDQTRAAQSARGIAMSPYGAGGEADVMKNFNIDWQNQQLARQAQGLSGYQSSFAPSATAYQDYLNQLGQGANTLMGTQGIANQAFQAPLDVNQQYLQQLQQGMNAFTGAGNVASQAALAQNAQAFMQNQTGMNALTTALGQIFGTPGTNFSTSTGNYNLGGTAASGLGNWLNSLFTPSGATATQSTGNLTYLPTSTPSMPTDTSSLFPPGGGG